MTRSRSLALIGSALLGIALLATGAAAQGAPRGPQPVPQPNPQPPLDAPINESDPRSGKDPRDVADPRTQPDPRDVEPDPLLEPPGPTLYEAFYTTGQDVKLKQAFGENGWTVLDYIQSQCTTLLSLHDRPDAATPAAQEQIAAMEEKGRKLARFADEALLDTRFQNYVETVCAWSEEQRQQFREGQELYRQGIALASAARGSEEALAALTPLEQALDHARRLGDGRLQVMTLVAIGRLQSNIRDEERARVTMHEAVRVGRELRDLDGVWAALSVLYESGIRRGEWEFAQESLQEQYLIAQDTGDLQAAQRVMQQLVNLSKARDDGR